MKSESSRNSSSIFLINSKPYIKFELEIFFEDEESIQDFGLLFFVDVLIHDPVIPVLSDSARSILSRFPTWTAMYEDSIERATPELATPASVAGSFLNSLIGEYLDNFEATLDLNQLDSFISSADEESIDWIYVSYSVPSAAISVLGNSIPLARTSSLSDFYNYRKTDYVYYHNLIDNQIITLQKFDNLNIDGITFYQEPVLYFNQFDEFGTRVGLKRLYLENNENYKKRILDVYRNIPSVNLESIKTTLRRELDIWRAYNATPDSDYLGATPEILEISDIESSTPYFSFDGVPSKKFFDFVKSLNEKYPSNFGYINWEQGLWDYSGINNEGVQSIPAVYDTQKATADYFQPGVGDLEDALLFIENDRFATVSFEGYFKAEGFKVDSYKDIYAPIEIDYEYYGDYIISSAHNPEAPNPAGSTSQTNGGTKMVYELYLNAHNQYATPSVFYKNFSYEDNENFRVKNYYSQQSPSSPEYNLITIFNSDGFTDPSIGFKEKTYGYSYLNTDSTPANESIDIKDVNTIKIIAHARWNEATQQYSNVKNADYRIAFNEHASGYTNNPSYNSNISISAPNINYLNANFKIGSTVYGNTVVIGNTSPIVDSIVINKDNDISSVDDAVIIIDDLKNSILYPVGTVPNNLYIKNIPVYPYPKYSERNNPDPELVAQVQKFGGYSSDPYTGIEYYIPSSPNIVYELYDSTNLSNSPIQSGFFETATISYSSAIEALVLTTGLSSTPNYPFKQPIFSSIGENEAKSTPMIFGYLDSFGNAYKNTEKMEDSGRSVEQNSIDSFIGDYNLNRNSFGITSQQTANDEYIITSINPVSLNEDIVLSSSKTSVGSNTFSPDTLIDLIYEEYDPQIQNYKYSPISVDARYQSYFDDKNINPIDVKQPSLKAGWLYLPEEEYYVYAQPIVDVYNGIFWELDLSNVPMQGAPILVQLDSGGKVVNYNETFFSDSSTPGAITFYNEETVIGSDDLALYLSYENISNISIQDMFSGSILVKSPLNPEYWIWSLVDENGNYILNMNDDGQYYLSLLSYIQSGDDFYYFVGNRLQILNSETHQSQIIPGREYQIKYKVNDSFYVERNEKKIYFSSTPDINSEYKVTYESSDYLSSTPSGLSLNVIENSLDEGYVFITDSEYAFDKAKIWISPYSISDNEDDLLYVSIISYDVNENPKPNQTFRIYGDYLAAEEEYLTTNENGFGKTIVRYSGSSNANTLKLNIQGISYPNINAHPNSQSSQFIEEFFIDLIKNSPAEYTFKAAVNNIKVKSNSIDDVYIKGYLRTSKNIPVSNKIVYWKKARTAYEALNEVDYSVYSSNPGRYEISGYTTTNQYGDFNIGPFYAQNNRDPGLWFVAVETELSSTPSATPVTMYGDIVYWYESYDNIHYSNEPLPLPRFYTAKPLSGEDIIKEPRFTYRQYDQQYDATPSATPEINWIPPKWFPISRYEQYQMGLLGSTPNVVSTYNNIYVDYEDN